MHTSLEQPLAPTQLELEQATQEFAQQVQRRTRDAQGAHDVRDAQGARDDEQDARDARGRRFAKVSEEDARAEVRHNAEQRNTARRAFQSTGLNTYVPNIGAYLRRMRKLITEERNAGGDTEKLKNARDAYMSLGINTCATAQRGDFSQFGRGWCKPSSKSELMSTAPDTSMIWSGMGMALSPDEQSILTYAITVPFTHNSWLAMSTVACRIQAPCL